MGKGEEQGPTLGNYLKALREARRLSQRDVERECGVSNAFLSQIESGKVKLPSPLVLYKIAELYAVPYDLLMERAGYPVPKGQSLAGQTAAAVFTRLGRISEEEEQALLDYLSFIRSRTRRSVGEK